MKKYLAEKIEISKFVDKTHWRGLKHYQKALGNSTIIEMSLALIFQSLRKEYFM
jgi:hypothetical protein